MSIEHRFFEKHLNNDLDSLYNFLMSKKEDIKNESLEGIDLSKAPKHYFAVSYTHLTLPTSDLV